jgi:uncharacterized protein YidB (DUF937 family)
MSKGSPSMVALLGLLAVAGYQNRDKIVSMMQGANATNSRAPTSHMPVDDDSIHMPETRPGAGVIEGLRGMLAGGGLAAGLSELIGRFTNPVQSARAQSWVDTGPNSEIGPDDLSDVLDEETLAELSQKTGLTRSELLIRLSAALPEAVDRLTPQGRMPTEDEAGVLI